MVRKGKKRKSFRWTLQQADLKDGKDYTTPFFNLNLKV